MKTTTLVMHASFTENEEPDMDICCITFPLSDEELRRLGTVIDAYTDLNRRHINIAALTIDTPAARCWNWSLLDIDNAGIEEEDFKKDRFPWYTIKEFDADDESLQPACMDTTTMKLVIDHDLDMEWHCYEYDDARIESMTVSFSILIDDLADYAAKKETA